MKESLDMLLSKAFAHVKGPPKRKSTEHDHGECCSLCRQAVAGQGANQLVAGPSTWTCR